MIGEMIIGTMTLPTTPDDQYTGLPDASAAPTRPPISACEDEDGRPKYQVTKFQTIAPINAESTTARPAAPAGGSMIDAAMVTATPVERKAPSKLPIAAMVSATRGVSARVETALAIALAASWKPLV